MKTDCMPKKQGELPFTILVNDAINEDVQEKELTSSSLPFKPTLTYREQVKRQMIEKGAHFT